MGIAVIEGRIREATDFPFAYESIVLDKSDLSVIESTMRAKLAADSRRVVEEFDATDADPELIREWLLSLGIHGLVSIVWPGFSEAIRLDFADFVDRYDDLWYPGSDDTWISSQSADWILELSHEEAFTMYR